jgi:hypothetical protein
MICVAWMRDKERRLYLSTATPVTDGEIPTEQYKPKRSKDDLYPTPLVGVQYNRAMWGVDNANQYAANQSPNRRTKRWWLPIVLHYFHVAVVNAYLLYSSFGAASLPTIDFPKFREVLGEELVAGFTAGHAKIGRPPSVNVSATFHTQEQSLAPVGGGERESGRCSVCCVQPGNSRTDKRSQTGSRTSFRCKECTAASDRLIWVCSVHKNPKCWAKHTAGK